MAATTVVGIDGCKTGWIAVCLGEDGAASAHYLATISDVTAVTPEPATIAIDIPIALPVKGRRKSDTAVRAALGARRNSLFFTPVRAAIEAATHALACEASIAAGAGGISQQAYRLGPKILEVAAWLPRAPCSVAEVHPELSFSLMLGRPATYAKTTWGGIDERTRALAAEGITFGDVDPEAARRASPDDMLDAAACAWTARRVVTGEATSFVDVWA
jgi:predicted RNase H-like nuclease